MVYRQSGLEYAGGADWRFSLWRRRITLLWLKS